MKRYTFTEKDSDKVIVEVLAANHDEAIDKANAWNMAAQITFNTDFYSEEV